MGREEVEDQESIIGDVKTTQLDLDELLMGLKAPRWHARARAAKLAASTCFMDTHLAQVSTSTKKIHVFDKLLRQLVHGLALGDSQWQVRMAAVESAATILQARRDELPADMFAKFVWGILAACLDLQPEVQQVSCHCVLQQLLPSSSQDTHILSTRLCDHFIATAIGEDGGLIKFSKLSPKSRFIGLDNIADGDVLLAAITSAVCLQLLPSSLDAKKNRCKDGPDRIPLLLVVTTVALNDANQRQSHVLARELSKLLRCLGIPAYRQSLGAMFNPGAPSYLCSSGLTRLYKDAGIIDEDIASTLKTVKTAMLLKGLSLAFEAVDPDKCLTNVIEIGNLFRPNPIYDLSQEELMALQHIVKMLDVPAEITATSKDQEKESRIVEFTESAVPLLSILTSIIKSTSPDTSLQEKLAEDIVLCCAAFAGGDGADGLTVPWASKELYEHSVALFNLLSVTISNLEVSRNKGVKGEGTLCLVTKLLPSVLPRIKQVIHNSSGISENGDSSKLSGDASVGSPIIAAYQMQWVIRQLEHPHLGPCCQLVMPCVLTALDHYSPEVKRQAMKTFIHLGKNMSSTEFQWYKDAILDAVSRNIVGCDDLWPVAVEMAVVTVTRIEGKNPRGRWYGQIFSEMIGELERHPDDKGRRIVWLQEILPQMEAMGLILVTYFKRLLPLLFHWLHARDDKTCLLTLTTVQTVITYTWPRVPAHMKRIWEEMMLTYQESSKRKLGSDIQAAVVGVCKKLHLCAGPAFEGLWQEGHADVAVDELISTLKKSTVETRADT